VSFYPYAKSYFESHPHKHEWNRKLAEMLTKGRLEHLADKAIRNRARDRDAAEASIYDPSQFRVIPQAEAEAQAAWGMQMKQNAETMRKEGVPV